MWSKQGKLNSCLLRRKAIETNFSRTLERVFLSLWIKKEEEELYGRIWNEGGI